MKLLVLLIGCLCVGHSSYSQDKCGLKAKQQLDFLHTLPFNRPVFKHNEAYSEYAYSLACAYYFVNKDSSLFFFRQSAMCDSTYIAVLDNYFIERMGYKFSPVFEKYVLSGFESKYGKYSNKEMIRQILRMEEKDQSMRAFALFCPDDAVFRKDMRRYDSLNRTEAKKIFNQSGFPSISMVGEHVSNAFFLLVQHADDDLKFQKEVLKSMDVLIKKKDLNPQNYAYLYDRIKVAETGKQYYGTQFIESGRLYPIVDSVNVDKRRAEVGLGSLAEYKNSIKFFK